MRDVTGKDICVGDLVVAAMSHGRNSGASLAHGIVKGFTPLMVRIEAEDYGIFLKQPEKVAVVD